ncbi:TetR/AcrR family transcriptional regulator C-terminal ligand-binding domain-containing protein [Microbacterium dauci]|uniref:TetR/AcrR family transcriptional regulator C-terminal ligand-binding domain-containing protein n=1 Tax=Microbacterium dauci TaxID=3048008 RepID=UPI003D2F765D
MSAAAPVISTSFSFERDCVSFHMRLRLTQWIRLQGSRTPPLRASSVTSAGRDCRMERCRSPRRTPSPLRTRRGTRHDPPDHVRRRRPGPRARPPSRDPALRDAAFESLGRPPAAAIAAVIGRAVDRGDLPPGAPVELAAGVIPAAAFRSVMARGRPLDAESITALIDRIVLPALRA